MLRRLEQGKAAESQSCWSVTGDPAFTLCFCAVKLIEPLIQAVVINSQTMSEVDALSFSSCISNFEFPSAPLVVWGLFAGDGLDPGMPAETAGDAQSAVELTEEEGEPSRRKLDHAGS